MLPKEEKEFEKWECLTGDKSRITGYNLYITGDIRQGQYGRRKCKAKVVGKAGLFRTFSDYFGVMYYLQYKKIVTCCSSI